MLLEDVTFYEKRGRSFRVADRRRASQVGGELRDVLRRQRTA